MSGIDNGLGKIKIIKIFVALSCYNYVKYRHIKIVAFKIN